MPEMNLENPSEAITVLEAYDRALEAYNSALQIYQQTDERLSEANAQRSIGRTLIALGEEQAHGTVVRIPPPPPPPPRFEEAVLAYRKALDIYQKENVLAEQAMTLMDIGNAYVGLGKSISRVSVE